MSFPYGPGDKVGKQSQAPRDYRTDAIYRAYHMQTKSYLFAAGNPKNEQLEGGFVARTIIVDNFSSLYLYIPAAERWAAPLAVQQVFPVQGVAQINLLWSAPPGITQPSDNLAPVVVTWLEKDVLFAPSFR